jgi:thiol-disulfide isomerase/thioredoxin
MFEVEVLNGLEKTNLPRLDCLVVKTFSRLMRNSWGQDNQTECLTFWRIAALIVLVCSFLVVFCELPVLSSTAWSKCHDEANPDFLKKIKALNIPLFFSSSCSCAYCRLLAPQLDQNAMIKRIHDQIIMMIEKSKQISHRLAICLVKALISFDVFVSS